MMATSAMSPYGMPVKSDIMKAADPITGGRIAPPVEAAASIAPARTRVNPVRIMSGMVKDPVVTTSAVGEPEIEP